MNKTVEEAKRLAGLWVAEQGSAIPGFTGAFLHGSINWLPGTALCPAASDVDVFVTSDAPELPQKPGKFRYRDVLLEVSVISHKRVESAEQVLGDHRMAGSFSTDCVLADPTGHLGELQAAVSRAFSQRKWVLRRCESARDHSLAYLHALESSLPPYEQATVLAFGTAITTDLLMTAGLENTTVRRKYAAVRQLLHRRGRDEVYELLLQMSGCAELGAERVTHHLEQLEPVFDAASKLIKSAFPFRGDISSSSRHIAIGGSYDLIEQGHPRDAVFWIVATHARCLKVFDHDGPPGALEHYSSGLAELLEDLDLDSYEARKTRAEEVEQQLPAVWAVAEELIATNPHIRD